MFPMDFAAAASRARRGRVRIGRGRTLFVAVLMTTTALTTLPPAIPAFAQSAGTGAAQAAAQDFAIPAQPVADALIQFGQQSGLQISADVSLVQNLRSAPVKGSMTWHQALATLLSGTGLTYRLNGSMVSLEK